MSLENIETTAVKELHKKRGRKPGKNRKGYFYEEEEDAFKRYITSTDQAERNKLFNEKLLPAFTKMIESIIRRYDLFTPSEDFNDTFYDTLSFLITKVNNFDITKGYKVYSYCGTICKNYLIFKRTQTMKQRDKLYPYDEICMENVKKDDKDASSSLECDLNTELINRMIEELQFMVSDDNKDEITNNERNVGYALLEILMNWEELFRIIGSDKFNKTSVLYFIKEYTSLNTTEVREAIKLFKNLYYGIKGKLLSE